MNTGGLLFVFAGLLLAPLLAGIVNRTKAVFAGRRGAPLLQQYRDISKLLRKGAVFSSTSTWIFKLAPSLSIACVLASLVILAPAGNPPGWGFAGDMIFFAYILGLSRFFTVAAALDCGSSFEGMGASREVLYSALAEPALLSTPQAVYLPYTDANWAQVSSAAAVAAATPPAARPVAPAATPGVATAAPPAPASASAGAAVDGWQWPTDGTLAGRFGAAGGKGIDIVGPRNTPVIAAAPGKVVYSGTGLRGYGKLLIVKHADEFLSAYAHNEAILVKEGDSVTAGQKIALMGDSDADRVKLHFEIRRYGKPLNPLDYLPERS